MKAKQENSCSKDYAHLFLLFIITGYPAQKVKFPIKYFLSKCDQICSFLQDNNLVLYIISSYAAESLTNHITRYI